MGSHNPAVPRCPGGKINGDHKNLRMNSGNMAAAWRSVGFAIKSVRPFSKIDEDTGPPELSDFAARYYSEVVDQIIEKAISGTLESGISTREMAKRKPESIFDDLTRIVEQEIRVDDERDWNDSTYPLLPENLEEADLQILIERKKMEIQKGADEISKLEEE